MHQAHIARDKPLELTDVSGDARLVGYKSAKAAVEAGRAAFFRSAASDLPITGNDEARCDALIPQFGFVGKQYWKKRILVLGINPGNGEEFGRSPADQRMMPALAAFAYSPTPENYVKAQNAYRAECPFWPLWHKARTLVGADRPLPFESFAYSNALPWRSKSKSAFGSHVMRNTARIYALPLIAELQPKLIVAYGAKVLSILESTGSPPLVLTIPWNREQRTTPAVINQRTQALADIRAAIANIH